MRRRPRNPARTAVASHKPLVDPTLETGLVLSGGGARAAYQVGALKALAPYISSHPPTVIVGSSIGALNSLIVGACLKNGLEEAVLHMAHVWRNRTFQNTFNGSVSKVFLRALRLGIMQYLSPGPNPTTSSLFDPTPLQDEIDSVLEKQGGLTPEVRHPDLRAVALMTTIEGQNRRPLLVVSSHTEIPDELMEGADFDTIYIEELTAKHGFASAALPSVLPPVILDSEKGSVTLVDGGISQNVPVDPAVRLGAGRIMVIDVSGRSWWQARFQKERDSRPSWEVPAPSDSYCLYPPKLFVTECRKSPGTLLREIVGRSKRRFIAAVGPTWPVYSLLRNIIGEEVAYETMSYVALDPEYLHGLIELGYNETMSILRKQREPDFIDTKKRASQDAA